MSEIKRKAIDAGVNVADFAIGIFSGISPLGPLKSVSELVLSVKNKRLNTNLKIFLENMADLTEEDYNQFYNSIEEEPQVFKENILLRLAEIDEPEKARIMANLTKARMKQKLAHSDYLRLLAIVSKAFVEDIKWLSYLSNLEIQGITQEETRTILDAKQKMKREIDIDVVEQNLFGQGLVIQKIKGDERSRQRKSQNGNTNPVADSIAEYNCSTLGVKLLTYGYFKPTYTK